MIEKLKGTIGNVLPQMEIIRLIQEVKKKKENIKVAEVGIGWGATAVEIIKNLGEQDNYYFFDYEENVQELYGDLAKINKNRVKLFPVGNTSKRYDSYAWNLAKILLEWRDKYETSKLFDIVYLDGAHTFLFDSSAASVLKEMIAPGGYIVLDDIDWTIAESSICNPKVNPSITECYTDEQINAKQVNVVKECLFDTDNRYIRVDNSKRIAIYHNIENNEAVAQFFVQKQIDEIQKVSDKNKQLFLLMNQWIKNKQEDKDISDYLKIHNYYNIAVYGLSYVGMTLVDELKGTAISVKYGIDRRAENIKADIKVFGVDENLPEVDAVIVTTVTDFEDISNMLKRKISCPIILLRDIL